MYKNSSIERRKGSPIAINKQLIRQDERKIGKKPTFQGHHGQKIEIITIYSIASFATIKTKIQINKNIHF